MENQLIFTFGHMIKPDILPEFIQLIKDLDNYPISWTELEQKLAIQQAINPIYMPTSLHIGLWKQAESSIGFIRGFAELSSVPTISMEKRIREVVGENGCNFRMIRKEIWETSGGYYWLDFEIRWLVDMFVGRFVAEEISQNISA